MQAQLKTAQAKMRPKFLIELVEPTQKKNCFLKIFNASKKIKNATHSRHSMSRQLNNGNGLQRLWTRTTGYNTGLVPF